MSYLLTAWAWTLSHPAVAYLLLTGAASLAYTKLEAYPRAHAVLSALAGVGLDLPTILDAIKRLFYGSPPTAGKAGPYRTAAKVDPDTTEKPATRWLVAPIVLATVAALSMVVLAITDLACTKAQLVQAVTNLTPAGACIAGQVASGNVDPLSIIGICGPITIEDIVKEIDALLAAPQGDGGTGTKLSVEYTTHLLTLRANCQKYLGGGDGGGQ